MKPETANLVITTGSTEMDKKMGGGLPLGTLALVEGEADAGKSVLAQQLTWGALGDRRTVTFYTCENTTRSLLRQMESIGLHVTDNFILGKLRTFVLPLTGEQKLDVLARLLPHMAGEPGGLCVVDSVTPFLHDATDSDTMAFFNGCKALCDTGKTIVIILHTGSLAAPLMMRIGSMCDAHLRLRTEDAGDKLIKVLEVAKIRGAAKATGNIITFNVEPGMGMRIVPFSKAKA